MSILYIFFRAISSSFVMLMMIFCTICMAIASTIPADAPIAMPPTVITSSVNTNDTVVSQNNIPSVDGNNSSKNSLNLKVFALISNADIVVQFIMLSLVITSIWSWTVILQKFRIIRYTKRRTDRCIRLFANVRTSSELFEKSTKAPKDNPIYDTVSSVLQECMIHTKHGMEKRNHNEHIAVECNEANLRRKIDYSMQAACNNHIFALEKYLPSLAVIANVTPFVGLLGTVWGIVVSFQSIAIAKNVSLATVAPGIAEALLATTLGLVVAIPAAIFYNKFCSEVDIITQKTDDFRQKVSSILLDINV